MRGQMNKRVCPFCAVDEGFTAAPEQLAAKPRHHNDEAAMDAMANESEEMFGCGT